MGALSLSTVSSSLSPWAMGGTMLCYLLNPIIVNLLGGQHRDTAVAMVSVCRLKNSWQNERVSWIDPKLPGNFGQYLSVLNWSSE